MSTAPAPTLARRPLLDVVRDESGGADHLKAELLAGRWIGYRYDDVADKYIDIAQAYWLDTSRANYTMETGIFSDIISFNDAFGKGTGKGGPYRCKVFVASAEAPPAKHAGGRPVVYDWVGVGTYLTGRIYNAGFPGKNEKENKKHLVTLMRYFFGKNGEGRIPKDTTMNQHASRILKELERD
jgi:hypothetical protein